MFHPRSLRRLAVSLLAGLTLTASSVPALDSLDWRQSTPAEIHRKLGESKAMALEARRRRAALAAEYLTPTDQTNYDVTFYDIYLRVNDTTEILYGRVGMTARATQDGVSAVDIDLYSNMTIDSIVGTNGPLTYARNGNVVTVTLDQAYNTGEPFSFEVYYYGHPVEGGFQAFSFGVRNGIPVISSLSEPYYARTWWPCKDRPDDKADSFKIAIEVASNLYCASNGTLDSVVAASANSDIYYYTVHYPMTTYLFSVAISEYTVWQQDYVYNGGTDTMPVVHAVYPDLYSYSLPRWGLTPDYIATLAQYYGEYPFITEKYGHANFEWGGGMEHQTMTSMTGSAFGFWEPVVVHELGHQWWGDLITCANWHHIWLNEGWASYSEALYYYATEGWQSYHDYMMDIFYTGGRSVYVQDTTSVSSIFNSVVYDKGAWVVHMLRGVLGDSLFWVGIDAFLNSQYRFGSATTEQFRDVIEQATGQELDWFFDEWVYGTYYPKFDYYATWVRNDSNWYDVYLVVKQTQTTNPQVFTMPVQFFVNYMFEPDDTLTFWVDERREVFKFTGPGLISYVALDPADWIMKSVTGKTWELFIVTLNEELSEPMAGEPYEDTLEYIGNVSSVEFSVVDGFLPPGLVLTLDGRITGIPLDTGTYTFTARVQDTSGTPSDEAAFTLHVAASCCQGFAGDVNCDPAGVVDVADLTALIDHLFINFTPLCCYAAGNVNGDPLGTVDVADLTALIDHLFINFSPTAPCP